MTALGMGASIPQAAADLPRAGLYKGKVKVTRILTGPEIGVPQVTETFKAVATILSNGVLRVVYNGGQTAVLAKLREADGKIFLDFANSSVEVKANRSSIAFLSDGPLSTVEGPEGIQETFSTNLTTTLTLVRPIKATEE